MSLQYEILLYNVGSTLIMLWSLKFCCSIEHFVVLKMYKIGNSPISSKLQSLTDDVMYSCCPRQLCLLSKNPFKSISHNDECQRATLYVTLPSTSYHMSNLQQNAP